MLESFYNGGPVFMGVLSLIFIIMMAVSVINGIPVLKGEIEDPEEASKKLSYIKSIGLFAFIIGLLGQLIGLFSAFRAIELEAVEASPSLIAAGFKVSMISSIYGLIIYALSLGIWFGLNFALHRK